MSIIVLHQALGFQITEIMFNPDGADSGREWIEIELNSSEECINLTEYKLFEEGTNHNIYESASDIFCKYAIISSDVNKFFQEYAYINNTSNVVVYKSTFSLSNSGENIAIKKGSEIIDEINYTLLIENINITEGYSLEYYSNYWRTSELLNGNPGELIFEENVSGNNTVIENSTNITNTIDDNSTNNTINTTNITTDNYCNIALNILIKNSSTIYENDVSIKFQNKLMKENYTNIDEEYVIDYWVEDLFGNIIKNKISTNNQDEKSFTPKIEEPDKILVIKNMLKNISCNLSNTSDVSGERIILIKNSKYSETKSKSATCPVCSSKATSCEPCICLDLQKSAQNNSQPFIKIINVCNASKESKETQNSVTENSFELGSIQIQDSPSNNLSNKSLASNTSKMTSMVIYESPNLKNRLYALIGLILVGLICTSIIVYKLASKVARNQKIE